MSFEPDVAPQRLAGQGVQVIVGGERKATGVLDDRRYRGEDRRIHEQVYLRIEEYEEDWARQLPRAGRGDERGAVASIPLDLKLEDGRRYDGVRLGRPWTEMIGVPVTELDFPLDHPEL